MLSYFNAYNKARSSSAKESFKEDFSAIVAQTFDNATNVFENEIEIETSYGTNIFSIIPIVRVDSIINFNTGLPLGDDFKVFIFEPNFEKPIYGMKFKWKNNYWLVINTNNEESVSISAEVRRCNNVLRFFDDKGNRITEPCIFDYALRFTNNSQTDTITRGSKEQKIWCQRNPKTRKIQANTKFLFGTPDQRVAFRLDGGGIQNTANTTTGDDTSPTLTQFYLSHYELNADLDDLENGFANAYLNQYSLKINEANEVYNNGISSQLYVSVYKNEEIVDIPVIWTSSNQNVATINSEGLLSTIGEGSSLITVSLDGNSLIKDTLSISVSNSPVLDNYEVVVEPLTNYILQGRTVSYDCFLYKNGEKQSDTFDFVNTTENVPSENYVISSNSGNSFIITNNKMYLDYPISIKCVSGIHEKEFEITLRGLY